MDKIARIRAEIERLESIDYPCETSEEATGFYEALDRISSFLDTLQEPDVDEAVEGETRIVYAKADLDPHGVDYGIRYLHLRLPDDTPVGTRYIVHIKPKKGLK